MSTHEQSLSAPSKIAPLFTTGIALFSMFFGAGNLIFPLIIGKSVGGNVWFAISGLSITAVIVPFLGLATMILFQADYYRFFGRIGKIPGLALLLVLQLILGPFGVIPRLVTLMHATAQPFLGMDLLPFSVVMAVVLFAFSFKRKWLMGLLGVYLTPILILSLAALVFFGLSGTPALVANPQMAKESFLQGLLGGYNTMDLIAAFLFATVVLPHFQKEAHLEGGRSSLLKKMFFSSAIAAALLFLSYAGLCLISAHHSAALPASCPSEQMLSAIATRLLGPIGGCVAAAAVLTACLTTAMTLASIFADYLRKDLCKEKISPIVALGATLAITTFFANLGFSGISAFLGPILQIVYPGVILLTVLNLLHALYGWQMIKGPVFAAFAAAALIFAFQ